MKGNLLVAHGGGPTAVMNAALFGILEEAARRDAIESVLGARHGIAGVIAEDLIALGREAVRAATSGRTGLMLTLERRSSRPYACGIGTVPLEKVANIERPLPDEFVPDEHGLLPDAFREYVTPLIGDVPKRPERFRPLRPAPAQEEA